MHKLRSVQVLRAVAACGVVALHASARPANEVGPAGLGAAGVDLFFVISGFIMANVARGRTARAFITDRLWRIYPLWWCAVLPWLFLVPRDLPGVASSVTLWPIYPGGYYLPSLEVGWTLGFELLFYCGMSLAIATRPALPLTAYAVLLAGALATSSPLLHFIGSPLAIEFLMGAAVARLPRAAWFGLLIPLGLIFLLLTDPAIGLVEFTVNPHLALSRVLSWGAPAALVLWGALSLERLFEHRLFRVPVLVGDASYSIYLFHPLVAYSLVAAWPLRAAAAVSLGLAAHLTLERRILAARKRSRLNEEDSPRITELRLTAI